MAGDWHDLTRPPLRERALRVALTSGDDPRWRVLDVVPETGSTNADLAARAREGEAGGAVLVAESQVSGRGRRDRVWTTPPRAALIVSVLLRPAVRPERLGWLTLLTGVAVVDAVRHVGQIDATLKWPNDVMAPVPSSSGVGLRKLAGLLAEAVPTPSGQAVVMGIGLNVSQEESELPVPTATSLKLAGAVTTDRDPVLRAVLRELTVRLRAWEAADGDPVSSGLADAYRERCSTIGQEVRVELPSADPLIGLAEGIDDDGRLLVRPASNTSDNDRPVRALSVGDVVHIRPTERA